MAPVVLSHVRKLFGDGTTAVQDLDLDVADGEALAVVGPPGSGKSTLLRIIAGLEDATSGTISLGGSIVNDVPAGARDVAMVFHTYALYPHMTVCENLGLPLEMRKQPPGVIASTVERVSGLLGLTDVLAKRPGDLTGAQRQRVAMGRALVREPGVLLMDEPFANLDVRQRAATRTDVRELLRALGTTLIYATGDADEAETMGDRVAVLRRGRVEQIGTAAALRERPANTFVASYAARPALNLMPATVELDHGRAMACIGDHAFELDRSCIELHGAAGSLVGRTVVLAVGPDDLALAPLDDDARGERGAALAGVVEGAEVVGPGRVVRVRLEVPAVPVVDGAPATSDGRARVLVGVDPAVKADTGARVAITVEPRAVLLFDAASGASLR